MYIGEPFSWKPAAFEGASGICGFEKLRTVHGRIVYINAVFNILFFLMLVIFAAEAEVNGIRLR